MQVLAKGGIGTTEDAEYTEEDGRVLLRRRRSVSKLISSWRGLSLLVLRGRRGCAGTPRVCSFLAGMKGNPFGGVLFNHVPFSQAHLVNLKIIGCARFEFSRPHGN